MVRRFLICAICAFPLLIAQSTLAADPFDGTWRIDHQKDQLSQKPNKLEILNGRYKCSTCVPQIDIEADGKDHKVAGSPTFDTMNVRVIDDRSIQFSTKQGTKLRRSQTIAVSPDGNYLTITGNDHPANSPQPTTYKLTETRVAKGPNGSHAVSGEWKPEKVESASENMLEQTFKVNGDEMTITTPTGISYTAKFDGKDYAIKGEPNADTVSLRRIDPNTIEETDKKSGKVVDVSRMTVSPDGHSMTIVDEDKVRGNTNKLVATKKQ